MAVFRPSRRGARRFSIKAKKPAYATRIPRPLTRTSFSPSAGPVNGFPEVLRTTLRYQDNYTLTSSSGSAAQNVFRLNSLFDPDFTGTGHQPLYYDQLSVIYAYYRVRYAKLHVMFLPLTDDTEITTTGPYQVGVAANGTSSFSSTVTTLAEQNNSKSALLGRDKSAVPVSMSTTFIPMRDLGVSLMDDTIGSTIGGNPGKPYFGCIYAADLNLTNGSVKAVVTITFDVEFYQQTGQTGS